VLSLLCFSLGFELEIGGGRGRGLKEAPAITPGVLIGFTGSNWFYRGREKKERKKERKRNEKTKVCVCVCVDERTRERRGHDYDTDIRLTSTVRIAHLSIAQTRNSKNRPPSHTQSAKLKCTCTCHPCITIDNSSIIIRIRKIYCIHLKTHHAMLFSIYRLVLLLLILK
jgi:hypothetical protein